jgi:D-beta-D-heptose 7-phosphate kinase/D-beta-D-heptose 1-phosphate adenosyltransferase
MDMIDFSKRRITVVGDVMLDRYIRGICTRVSPEAPVPVVNVESVQDTLGGAGNVAANCASLGCKVNLVGATGNETDVFFPLARFHHIEPYLYSCASCDTTKTRIIANDQQAVRYDTDGKIVRPFYVDPKSYFYAHAIIISDYGKGFVTRELCETLIGTKISVFVDPKDGDWGKYKGAFCIKPNEYELERHLGYFPRGLEEMQKAFNAISERYGFQCILLTLGKKGMALWRRSWNAPVTIPAMYQEVYDVSGAGDTAIAVFAAAQELGLLAAAQLANRAAGLVVGKRGTSVITTKELLQ